MAVAPISPPSDNEALQKAIEQWQANNKRWQADYEYLHTMISEMMKLCKEGKTSEAFQIAEQDVMPSSMTVQGESMGGLAGAMNDSSAVQKFITDMQNDLNGGGKMTADQAKNFVTLLKQLYDRVNDQVNNTDPKNQWMDKSTAENLKTSLEKLAHEFGSNATPDNLGNPNGTGAQVVQGDIQYWNQNPTVIDNGNNGGHGDWDTAPNETGQQHIQNILADVTQGNNNVSAQNQALTAEEQFAANMFNQYMNSCQGVFQGQQKFIQSMVNNQKG